MRTPHILLVDNIASFRKAHKRHLEAQRGEGGRPCFEVSSVGSVDDALAQIRAPVDLALIDLRLVDDRDPYDFSGLELCRKIKQETGTFCVLLTEGPISGEQISEWRKGDWIDDHQAKSKDARMRREEIAAFLRDRVQTNFGLHVKYEGRDIDDEGWLRLTEAIEEHPVRMNEVSHLFHRVIPKSVRSIEIMPMEGGASGAAVVRATANHACTGLREELIIKYGDKEQVWTEGQHFDKCVAPLGPRGAAPRRWAAKTTSLAAIAYASIRTAEHAGSCTLADYLGRPDSTYCKETAILASVFHEACHPWYEAFIGGEATDPRATVPESTSLRQYLLGHFWSGRDQEDAIAKLEQIRQNVCSQGGVRYAHGRITASLGTTPVDVFDPVDFVLADHADGFWPRTQHLCMTHGDFHPRNIFVLDGMPWIIDFADTDWGPLFRDFATLETALRFTAVYDFQEREAVFRHEETLAEVDFYPSWWAFRAKPRTLGQAARLTYRIRQEARRLSAAIDPRAWDWRRDYMAALVFSLLKIAGIRRVSGREEDRHITDRRLLSYLSAGSLAGKCIYDWGIAARDQRPLPNINLWRIPKPEVRPQDQPSTT